MLPTKGTNRYDWLRTSSVDDASKMEPPSVRRSRITKIEKADFLNPSEKLQVLLVLTHHTFTGEIAPQPNKEQREELLTELKLPYFINSYQHSSKGLIRWLQFSANQQIHTFVKKHHQTMSVMEAGLLYRYPTTAILAYAGLIPRQERFSSTTPADFFFGMVHSKEWLEIERTHYEQIFQIIQVISPKIYQELMIHYHQWQSSS